MQVSPPAHERGAPLEGTEGRRGLSMRAGVPSGTQGDGPGRWPPRTRRRAAGPGSVSLGGARRRGPPDGPPANIELARPRPGAGEPRQAAKRPETGPDLPGEMYAESGQRVGGRAPWGRACAPKPGGGTTTLPQGCFVLCARSSYSNLFSTGGVGRRWTIKQPPDALTTYGGCDILEVDGCRRPTIIRGRVSHLSQRYYYIMGVIDCPDRPPHLIR